MYDFWFTLGTVVTRPVFLDRVLKHAKPNFKRITRTIVETDPSLSEPPRTTATVNEISAGLLGIEGTPKFRVALHKQLAKLAHDGENPVPPPISVYAAGRLSQLLIIDELGFSGPEGYIAAAQKAFKNALAHTEGADYSKFPRAFPAFIGLLLIDGGLRELLMDTDERRHRQRSLVKRGNDPIVDDINELLDEFGISENSDDPVRQVIYKFIDGTDMGIQSISRVSENPWDFGCPDWIVYWPPQSDRAVI